MSKRPEFKVGDDVAVVFSEWIGGNQVEAVRAVGKVERITPSGQIVVSGGLRFAWHKHSISWEKRPHGVGDTRGELRRAKRGDHEAARLYQLRDERRRLDYQAGANERECAGRAPRIVELEKELVSLHAESAAIAAAAAAARARIAEIDALLGSAK